jgi:DNA-directed RNA polymerase subunit K/omega
MSDDDDYYSVDGENNSDSDSDSNISDSNIVLKNPLKHKQSYDDYDEDEDVQFGGEDDTDEIKKVIDEDDDDDDNEDNDDEDDDNDDDNEDDNDEDEDIYEEESNLGKKYNVKKITKPKKTQLIIEDDEDEEDEDYEDENYLQKFDNHYIKNYITDFHPECLNNNYEEISQLSIVVRNSEGIIIDPLHKTIPYLTKYEKARILGQRAKQIETGSKPLVRVPENIIDGYIIAELELKEKKIPFIIRRPIPNGSCEYWHLKDLEIIGF